ncbi:hypothetical protein TNCV_2413591 [Trichonephila clavipes]|nr:hypothetical protein TNCV_2413591 [Trichonephila clavipes]
MMLKSAIVYPFSRTSNGLIASTHMKSVSPICFAQTATCNPMIRPLSLIVACNEFKACGEDFFQSLKGILNRNAAKILTIRLRIASYRMRSSDALYLPLFIHWASNFNHLSVRYKCLCTRNFIAIV